MTTTPTRPLRPAEETLHSALSGHPRPRRPGSLSASLTFGWRAFLKIPSTCPSNSPM
jgi:ABC-2 type transport system permease protein